LELACWGAATPPSLCWLDPPPAAPLAQARDLLRQLEAIDSDMRITPHGRPSAKLGVHPRSGAHAGQIARAGRTAPRL
jgi:ATP-dependent helicase HrpB